MPDVECGECPSCGTKSKINVFDGCTHAFKTKIASSQGKLEEFRRLERQPYLRNSSV